MTAAVEVSWTFRIITDPPLEMLHDHSRLVMEELLKLELCSQLSDSAVSLNLDGPAGPEITIEVCVVADDYQAAIADALGGIRTAIHAAGGATPGWEDAFIFEPGNLQAQLA